MKDANGKIAVDYPDLDAEKIDDRVKNLEDMATLYRLCKFARQPINSNQNCWGYGSTNALLNDSTQAKNYSQNK